MDKLNAISIFCKVVETQSFTQAATQQNISVAMASKLVSQLEEHLKTRLLQRTTRKIMPTEAGIMYYQRCQGILQDLDEADASISNMTTSLQGNLLISVPRDFGLLFISSNLPMFIAAHPNLHVEVEFNDKKIDLLAEGYDLALRIGYMQDSSLVARKISTSTIHFAASPRYLERYGMPATPNDLEHHEGLLYKSTLNQVNWQGARPNQTQRFKIKSKVVSNNGLALLDMAKAGLGIVNLPRFILADAFESGELVEILPEYKQQELEIHIVYPNRRHLPAKVRAFIDFLASLGLCSEI
ncbi:LysR family transcriptional regulator [Rodentibacter pneumotropicus]|uniref:LysR family transcriptional regulator n=2 Tax=Rodentibacter pneumotropicus TaxID=758 RepID=A0A4S2PF69_9PAST|nr:LysR family transcriptional regulator [Rodentibacter pneumotropicus]NBH74818.1 LysR family transcriptional regulator [Rodentibacter pneumotropicus]OOF60817.1 LysR family transcriptional regulator [Rodentibacter pneumotropicus]TGZ99686.1 LysR family transcriptional regulator [Rodentibacter pneumotropicus]THA01260.1 LysR family transcriptional regulator [Rodentibacter pneumotropicus]THA01962.1 LysR family transcriptional regulator [Rodentibacter pneumotropicus]